MKTNTFLKASTAVAFTHARTRALVIEPTFGFAGDVCPKTDADTSRAWSPPV